MACGTGHVSALCLVMADAQFPYPCTRYLCTQHHGAAAARCCRPVCAQLEAACEQWRRMATKLTCLSLSNQAIPQVLTVAAPNKLQLSSPTPCPQSSEVAGPCRVHTVCAACAVRSATGSTPFIGARLARMVLSPGSLQAGLISLPGQQGLQALLVQGEQGIPRRLPQGRDVPPEAGQGLLHLTSLQPSAVSHGTELRPVDLMSGM